MTKADIEEAQQKYIEQHRHKLAFCRALEQGPLLEEQKRIATMLKEKMQQAQRLHPAIEAQLEAVDKLPAAISREAFPGRI